jgi:hypothetical protein
MLSRKSPSKERVEEDDERVEISLGSVKLISRLHWDGGDKAPLANALSAMAVGVCETREFGN